MSDMAVILIVDDDIAIGDMEQAVLTKAGYNVLRAYSGTEAIQMIMNDRPDLVLLDLMLPGLAGEDVMARISKSAGDIPVMVVSAKIDADSKVNMLLEGACDYLTKPFDTRELLARIKLRLRERGSSDKNRIYIHGDIRIDDSSHEVTVSNVPVKLTKTEYGILKILMEDPETVVTKSSLIDRVSSGTEDCTESSLKTHVSHLRSKLAAVSRKDYIESVWGIGFKMNSNLN